jgi:hypothetical protein
MDMEKMMSEKMHVILDSGSKKNCMRISLSEYNGTPILNIRNYFEKDGEMRPTKKGISISRNKFLDLAKVFSEHQEYIASFLENTSNLKYFDDVFIKKTEALDSVKTVETANLNIGPTPGRNISEIKYSGSTANVKLDENHKFVRKYSGTDISDEILKSFFLAVDLSLRLVADDESNEVKQSLDRFEYELSRQLRNLTEE